MKIIFTHLKPDIWQYKVASTLRKKGIKAISISLLDFDRKMFCDAFDEIISLGLPNLKPLTIIKKFIRNPLKFLVFFKKILTIKADTAICQGAPHYLTAIFIRLFKRRFPRIYFPYDMNFSRYKHPEKYELPKEIWGEKYSFKNCDAIIIKSTEKELNLLPTEFNIKSKPVLVFPCYALTDWNIPFQMKKKLSYLDKETHIVCTGWIIGAPFYKPAIPDFQEILKQKIHFHFYPAREKLSKEQFLQITKNNKDLKSFFHVHEFVQPEKLSKEICKYDFGYYFSKYSKKAKPDAIKFSGATNKISSYFEASLPVIINEENWVNSEMIENNYLGISIKNIKNLKKHIKKFNYSKSIKNIQKFKKEFSVENHINELIKFTGLLKMNFKK